MKWFPLKLLHHGEVVFREFEVVKWFFGEVVCFLVKWFLEERGQGGRRARAARTEAREVKGRPGGAGKREARREAAKEVRNGK